MTAQTGYHHIKALAKQHGMKVAELLAMATKNDPFFAGGSAQRAKAEWFARLWHRFGYQTGVHLRRVHYQLVVQHRPLKHDATAYQNTEACWGYLKEAGKAARYLGLVSPDAFEDHRNPDPLLFLQSGPGDEVSLSVEDLLPWPLPVIRSDLTGSLFFPLPEVEVSGYRYSQGDQPYHLEVWIEKTTQDDILVPLCRELGVNLVPAAGFQSITAVVNLLRRVATSGKPARVLYVSDFDPAGDHMPSVVARQVEFWLPKYAPGADIKLTPLALTAEQAEEYRLPRAPIKEQDGRRAGFEERHGRGAVELDALEALRPGEFARIVRRAVAPYRDETLHRHLSRAEDEALDAARRAWEDATAESRGELEAVEREATAIAGEYQARLDALNDDLQLRLAPLKARLAAVRHGVELLADSFTVQLPDRPVPLIQASDESGWLFDSARGYFDQLACYKARKRGPSPEGAEGP
jgi:hypothetical protein